MPRLTQPMMFASAEECEQSFYEALDAGDADAVINLWLEEDDVCCVHPGGPRLIGFAAVKAAWTAILANNAMRIRATGRKALETPTVVMSNVVEEIAVEDGRDSRIVHVIATNAYVKTAAGWKMVLHHASPVPDGQAQDIEGPQGPLH